MENLKFVVFNTNRTYGNMNAAKAFYPEGMSAQERNAIARANKLKIAEEVGFDLNRLFMTLQPKDRGEYARKWKVKTTSTPDSVECTIYNQLYGLTHLLENGHALRQGGRSPSTPHIQKNEQKANKDFEEGCKEIINNAGY